MPTKVPVVVGLPQSEAEVALKNAGLVVGNLTKASSDKVAAGNISRATPAAGTLVDSHSVVDLEVSTGPRSPGQVVVPNLIGLTRQAAETKLKNVGLIVGAVKNEVPAGGITTMFPDAGTQVNPGTEINFDLSSGPRLTLFQKLPPFLFAFLGFAVIALIAFIIVYPSGQSFLMKLSQKEVARGLITFLIALSTVGIAIILAISTVVLTEGTD